MDQNAVQPVTQQQKTLAAFKKSLAAEKDELSTHGGKVAIMEENLEAQLQERRDMAYKMANLRQEQDFQQAWVRRTESEIKSVQIRLAILENRLVSNKEEVTECDEKVDALQVKQVELHHEVFALQENFDI